MALKIDQPTTVNWTISDKMNEWNQSRVQQEKDFDKNYQAVATQISNNITHLIFSKLNEEMTNKMQTPFLTPLNMEYALNVYDPTNIKKLCGDSAELSPFKDWFVGLENGLRYGDSKFSSVSIVTNPKVDVDYFQSKISKLGPLVEQLVQQNLANFAHIPQNSSLKYNVEWFSKQTGYSFSHKNDNSLYVKLELKK